MSFAYWRKCDFQIHTPRDPNWAGLRPVGVGDALPDTGEPATQADVDAARRQWAETFVQACIDRGLGAVALTDHHEMVMVPHVQQAIADKRQVDPDFDLWLFPGMELTARSGVQCLILFDADLPEEWRHEAQGRLGIVRPALNEQAARAPAVVQLAYNYADIANELNTTPDLRGRFIVLPNVSQGGQHTVLTGGCHADFLRMPYVGGYLDKGQTIETLSNRFRTRLSGTDPTWSTRFIYPLPTSDSRSSDFRDLGTNETWIKLASPTAEAVRQAYLGHPSRIRITVPEIPSLTVSRIAVNGSNILQQPVLDLSPELNSVIGGRGSGKSSLLEYLAFGLGRSSYDQPREHYSGRDRMHSLVNDSLVTKNGTVQIQVQQDGAIFEVSRGPATAYQPVVTYPDGTAQTITVKELRDLFPSVVYSQSELAEMGKSTGRRTQLSDLLQFVNQEYKQEDDRLLTAIDDAKSGTRTAIQHLTEHWAHKAQLRALVTSKDSLKQRIQALEKTLPTQSEDDQAKVAYFETVSDFETKRSQASDHADQIVADLSATQRELAAARDLSTDLGDEVKGFQEKYASLYGAFHDGIDALHKQIVSLRTGMAAAEADWQRQLSAARTARDGVLDRMGAHRTVTTQIIKLREDLEEKSKAIRALEARIGGYGDPSEGLSQALGTLRARVEERASRTREWAQEIEELSGGKVKANVDVLGNTAEINEAIDYLASKTGSQEATRVRQMEEALRENALWDWLDQLRTECQSLLYWNLVGAAGGEEKPECGALFTLLGATDGIKTAFQERMDSSRVEAIATAVPTPEIDLFYCDGDREIAFEKASEGQRAAALLFMLLEQEGGPLVVDQPEGDLDNKIISDLTHSLHGAKQKRQIVFASHNANIVVNGSSELVGYLDVSGEGSRIIAQAGAIDNPEICAVITATMEGGEKAFRDRQDKYGY